MYHSAGAFFPFPIVLPRKKPDFSRFIRLLILLTVSSAFAISPLQSRDAGKKKPIVGEHKTGGEQNAIIDPVEKKLRDEINRLRMEKDRLKLLNDIQEEKYRSQVIRLKAETGILYQENARRNEELNKKAQKMKEEMEKINYEMKRLSLLNARINYQKVRDTQKLTAEKARLEERKVKRAWDSRVNKKVSYPANPYRNRILTVSDRRIPLNGIISYDLADDIVRRINYFNNKSTKRPIFIIIDASPGGSVVAGYRILKAIEASKAPVHIVVKSYAASMAAVLVTMTRNSYAYPSAILLHHQVSGFSRGNITQQKERLILAEEWMQRLSAPVARKMGISLKEFVRKMYEHNSDGNWWEFADRAVKLKWVNHLVDRIEDESVRKMPTDSRPATGHFIRRFGLEEMRDENGRPYVELPQLIPYDIYFLHNPDGFYRLP